MGPLGPVSCSKKKERKEIRDFFFYMENSWYLLPSVLFNWLGFSTKLKRTKASTNIRCSDIWYALFVNVFICLEQFLPNSSYQVLSHHSNWIVCDISVIFRSFSFAFLRCSHKHNGTRCARRRFCKNVNMHPSCSILFIFLIWSQVLRFLKCQYISQLVVKLIKQTDNSRSLNMYSEHLCCVVKMLY
jgi:hypothetical protein